MAISVPEIHDLLLYYKDELYAETRKLQKEEDDFYN